MAQACRLCSHYRHKQDVCAIQVEMTSAFEGPDSDALVLLNELV